MTCYPRFWRAALILVPAAALAACASTGTAPVTTTAVTVHGLKQVHDPGHVTGRITGHCHMTGVYPNQLPDRRCTPGSIDPAVTQANIHRTICVTGYTKRVRPPESQTEAFKFNDAYPAYGVAHRVKTELDHQVSLELGGSNDATNLWPEPEKSIPNTKDRVENAAHAAVCSGRMTLVTAQNDIAKNWVALGRTLHVKNP